MSTRRSTRNKQKIKEIESEELPISEDNVIKDVPLVIEKKLLDESSNDGNSSDSSVENYLKPAHEIDLNSSFFSFEDIEKNPGTDRNKEPLNEDQLSDSENSELENESRYFKNEESVKVEGKSFENLENYHKKIEEARLAVEKYKKMKTKQEKTDIKKLLSLGETKTEGMIENSYMSASSDEELDWDEIESQKALSQATKEIPKGGVQITVEIPTLIRKKKKDDHMMQVRRRLNRIKKENQVNMHKVHLLCWIAHGNYVNATLNSETLLGLSLSLIPSENCYPPERADLSYLEQITRWYGKVIKLIEKTSEKIPTIQLEKILQIQFNKKEANSKKNYVLMFICILRALGLQCRLVLSLRCLPLKPPPSELCSLSVKNIENEATQNKPSCSKTQDSKNTNSKEEKNIINTQKASKQTKETNKNTDKKITNKENRKSTKQEEKHTKKTEIKKEEEKEKIHEKSTDKDKTENSKEKETKRNTRNTKKNTISKNLDEENENKTKIENVAKEDKIKEKVDRKSSTKLATNKQEIDSKEIDNKKIDLKGKEIKRRSIRKIEEASNIKEETNNNKEESKTEKEIKRRSVRKIEEANNTIIEEINNKIKEKTNNTIKEETKPLRDKNKSNSEVVLKKRNSRSNNKDEATSSKVPRKSTSLEKPNTSEDEFRPDRRSASLSPQKRLKNDVRNDIINILKGDILQQKQAEKQKIVRKSKTKDESESDSDYMPEPEKKPRKNDSGDEFKKESKVKSKVKQRVKPKSVIDRRVLSTDDEDDGKRIKEKAGNDVWVEVFLEAEEKWISVDVIKGQVHCVSELHSRASTPVTYVLAWNNNFSIKDVTSRYCPHMNTITRKLRIDTDWWNKTLKPYLGSKTARDKEEDEDLARQQLDQPLPKTIGEYKNHPLYALKRHLLKFEAIYPPDPITLGFVRQEAVYARECVHTLHSREIWIKHAKVVKPGEQPYKIVKARPKYDKLSGQMITDKPLEIFGIWQVDDYVPPTAENGVVPRNAFGNVELFKSCMLPKGTVHLQLPGLNKICRRLNIDCAPALVGFDYHSGGSHPAFDGYIVCEEFEDQLIVAWEEEQEEIVRREQEKIEKRVYDNWRKLIKGLLIREKLKHKYGFETASGSGKAKKKPKGPRFTSKKRRIVSDSESSS